MTEHDDSAARAPVPAWATHVRPGFFDPRVLNHEFWIDAQADIRYVDELSTNHLRAIVRMLVARRVVLYGAELINTYLRVAIAREEGLAAGEQLVHDLGEPTIVDLEPVEWLETTALLRAIRRTLRARD